MLNGSVPEHHIGGTTEHNSDNTHHRHMAMKKLHVSTNILIYYHFFLSH